ncbi:hypothetical protein EV126DRAFT_511226 [Verticillium dahliae]|uniref:WHIM1 domain-containing protein n=1 Tax=Verticillium dahliae TaxID=27337 RepID=A0AA45APH2_VERDA|nr:hypothetical protein VdG2_06180 [Verticillium dahliae VDG2]KAH6708160.1 hypothetical protein EV126DRAFT_511226 [Verticillium dahliae]PNH35217.1 hypothetical protein BJF96_g1625 [Verticillium dahliae]PNH42249.1 hypothetical protein VD0003_g9836 [Verticillium dahliae]
MADDSSDLSSLSSLSPAPSDMESDNPPSPPKKGIQKFFPKVAKGKKATTKKEASPPPRKRSPSPPHEFVLADNPDIAFIVMFRSRFNEAMPKSLANFGPQELETDISDSPPGQRVENFLCAVLGLLLNRKQDVKPGHYMRALEDAISSHKSQWPRAWEGKSPLSGGVTFNDMNNVQRLKILRALILWSLSASDAVKAIITKSYKQNRHEDDMNQPLSVQPWGSDSDKRRYFLVEGLDDTAFRVYREGNPASFNRVWISVAGSIEELNALAEKLQTKDGGPKAKKLAQQMLAAVPRFEATEEKRRRREYRQAQRNRFKRPSPGFSLYEGRTRGKRVKYTYSDEEDGSFTDSTRRSTRNTGTHTPTELAGPLTTASGRQVRAPNRLEAEGTSSAAPSVQGDDPEDGGVNANGRPRRSAAVNYAGNGRARGSRSRGYSADETDDEGDLVEPDLGDDEEEADDHQPEESEEDDDDDDDDVDDDEAMVEDDLEDRPRQELIVELKVKRPNPKDGATATNLTPSPEGKKEVRHEKPDDQKVPTPKSLQTERTPEPEIVALPGPTSLAFRGSPEKSVAAGPVNDGSAL